MTIKAFEFNKQSKSLQMKLILLNIRRILSQEKKWLVRTRKQLRNNGIQRILTEWNLEAKRRKFKRNQKQVRLR